LHAVRARKAARGGRSLEQQLLRGPQSAAVPGLRAGVRVRRVREVCRVYADCVIYVATAGCQIECTRSPTSPPKCREEEAAFESCVQTTGNLTACQSCMDAHVPDSYPTCAERDYYECGLTQACPECGACQDDRIALASCRDDGTCGPVSCSDPTQLPTLTEFPTPSPSNILAPGPGPPTASPTTPPVASPTTPPPSPAPPDCSAEGRPSRSAWRTAKATPGRASGAWRATRGSFTRRTPECAPRTGPICAARSALARAAGPALPKTWRGQAACSRTRATHSPAPSPAS
jgi:hypothetical protein